MKDEENLIEGLAEPISLTSNANLQTPNQIESLEVDTLDPVVDVLDTKKDPELLENPKTDSLIEPLDNEFLDVTTPEVKADNNDAVYIKPKKKRKGKKFIIIFFLLIILIITSFALYVYFWQTPSKVYNTAIDNIFNSLKQASSYDKFYIEGSMNINTVASSSKEINDYALNYKFGADYQKEQMNLYLDLSEKNESFLAATLYLINNKIYLDSENLYDNILYISDLAQDIETLSTEDQNYVIDKMKIYLKNSLDENYLKREFMLRDSMPVIRNKLTINNSNIKTIINKIITSIKNDEKLIAILAQTSDLTSEEYQENLNFFLETDYTTTDSFSIILYTNMFTGNLVEANFTYNDEIIGKYLGNTLFFNYENVDLTFVNQNQKINLSININSTESKITFLLNGQISYDKALEDINVKNAQDINYLSEEEKSEIINNFEKAIEGTILYDFYSLFNYSDNPNFEDESDINSSYEDETIEVSPYCDDAVCEECTNEYCDCVYYDDNFNKQNIKCSNNNY